MGEYRLLVLGTFASCVIGCITPSAPSKPSSNGSAIDCAASSKPSPTTERSEPGRGLSAEQIRRVVMSSLCEFQQCHERELGEHPDLMGAVMVAGSITPEGTVSSAGIATSTLDNAKVESCIVSVFERMEFPPTDKPTNFSFPFVFRPPQ